MTSYSVARPSKAVRLLFCSAALVAVMGAVALAVGWWLTGGRPYSVQTASMEPLLNPGDVVLTRPIAYQDLQLGQVVTFGDHEQTQPLTTHRVTAINRPLATFTTQGDNLATADLPHRAHDLVGQAVWVAPGLGHWLARLRQPTGLFFGIYLPLAALVGYELYRLSQAGRVYRAR